MRSFCDIEAFGNLLEDLQRLSEESPLGQKTVTSTAAINGMLNVVKWVLGDDVVDEEGLSLFHHLVGTWANLAGNTSSPQQVC